jgi:hypothetical protein
MISWLFHYLICYIETAIVVVFNLLIAACALFIAAIVALCPTIPALPSMPSQISDSLTFGEYWFPLDWFFTNLGVFFVLVLAWMVISIPLRYVKAVRGSQ